MKAEKNERSTRALVADNSADGSHRWDRPVLKRRPGRPGRCVQAVLELLS